MESITKLVEKVYEKYPDDKDIWALLTCIQGLSIDAQNDRLRIIERRIDFLENQSRKTESLVDALDTLAESLIQRNVEQKIESVIKK